MKMNWKKVLYALFIGAGITMGMTACSDNDSEGNNPLNPDENLEEGYFSFQSLMETANGTRATEEVGTNEENKVNTLRVVLYDAATNIAEYAYTYTGTVLHSTGQDFKGTGMYFDGFTPDIKNFMPKAMIVKKKPYKLLAIVNPNDEVTTLTLAAKEYTGSRDKLSDNTLNLSNAEVFKTKYGTGTANLSNFIGAAKDGFLMTNFQEFVNVPVTSILPTEASAYAATVKVKVDRAVAKVGMVINYANVSTASNGIVSDGAWKLDVTNKTSYWMRHMTKSLGGTANETAATDRADLYAEDTNFDGISRERYTAVGATYPGTLGEPNTFFNYITSANVNNALADKTMSYEYALENTMVADEQHEDVTTAAILKIKYLPSETALGANHGVAPYYVWKGYVFTAAELNAIKAYDVTSNDPLYETFMTLKQYLIANEGTLEAAGAFGPAYNYNGTSKKVGDLEYNADGINYYRILIRHFNDTQEPGKMAYGRFGVVRNNVYKLTLVSIAGPGSIDIPKPEGPDDKEQFLSVSIEVLPWVVREQQVVIE